MRYVTFITLIFVLLSYQFLPAQAPDTLWTKTYGSGIGRCIIETTDNCYVVVGNTYWWHNGSRHDLRLIKTDSDGDTIWTKTYGDTNYNDFGYSVRQTSDGGYVIVGTTSSYGAGQEDVLLLRTDEFGDTLWTKTFGGDSSDVGKCVQITNDDGFIIVGSTKSFGVADENVWLIRTDLNGDTLWTKVYGDSAGRQGNYVIQTSDSGYAIVGGFGAWGQAGVWFAKTNPTGDLQMIRTHPAGLSFGRCLLETNNGYMISWGGDFVRESWGGLIRTDFSGDTLWTNSTNYICLSIDQTFNGHYLTCGLDVHYEEQGGYLTLFDENGNEIWSWHFGGWLVPRSAIQTSDGSFVMTGNGFFITKLGTATNLKQSEDIITESFFLSQNFPNPFNPTTTIEFDLPKTSEVSLKVFNILGEEVVALVSERLPAGSYSYAWDASNLASGVYLYRLQAGDYVETRKMVLMR